MGNNSGFKAIADAIRAKEGTSEAIEATDYANRIKNLQLGSAVPSNVYKIEAKVVPEGAGVVTGIGYAQSGMTVQLTATPNSGYSFSNWTENGSSISTSSSLSFSISKARSLVANFK